MAVGQASDSLQKLTKYFHRGVGAWCLSLAWFTVAQLEFFVSSDYLWVISHFVFHLSVMMRCISYGTYMRDYQCLCLPTAYLLLICALIVWGVLWLVLVLLCITKWFFTFAIIPSEEEMAGCSTLIVFLLALLIVFGALSLFLKVS